MEQIIHLVNEVNVRTRSLSEGDLGITRKDMKYRAIFPDLVKCFKTLSSKPSVQCGPMYTDSMSPQSILWDSVRRVMNVTMERILLFIKKFGIVEGNELLLLTLLLKHYRNCRNC